MPTFTTLYLKGLFWAKLLWFKCYWDTLYLWYQIGNNPTDGFAATGSTMPFQFMRFHLDMHIHICTTKMHTCIWKNVATDTSGPRLEYFQLISYFFVTSQQGKIKCVAALEPDFIHNYFLWGICSTLVIIAINVIYTASYTIFSSLGPIFFTLLYICKNTMFSPYGWNLSPITSFRLHFLGTICATLHCVTISHKNLDQTSATKSGPKFSSRF